METATADGLLLIDKPEGISSFGVIERLQRAIQSKTGQKKRDLPSFGHGGTLDPFATGLLLLCVGKGVKLSRYFLEGGFKTYEADLKFGEKTSSGDCTNPVVEKTDVIPKDLDLIREASKFFLKTPYLQTPPMYSAKKVDGKRLYELARKGVEMKREARACELRQFEILSLSGDQLSFRVEASSGTFIRTLAEDLAERLGSLAHLTRLSRIQSGPYLLKNALSLDEWSKSAEAGMAWSSLPGFIPIDRMLDHFRILEVSEAERGWLRTGLQAEIPGILCRLNEPDYSTETRAALKYRNELIGVAVKSTKQWELERIIPLDP